MSLGRQLNEISALFSLMFDLHNLLLGLFCGVIKVLPLHVIQHICNKIHRNGFTVNALNGKFAQLIITKHRIF